MKGQYFRAGAGAVIVNEAGEVLAFERAGGSGSLQFPQGGMDPGEEPFATVLREVEEETGIAASDLRLLGQYPEPIAYELPPELRSEKTGRGQTLYWFAFCLRPGATINLPSSGEFKSWRWMPLDELTATVIPFRRPVYARLSTWLQTLGEIRGEIR